MPSKQKSKEKISKHHSSKTKNATEKPTSNSISSLNRNIALGLFVFCLAVGSAVFFAKCNFDNNYCIGNGKERVTPRNPESEGGDASLQETSSFLGPVPLTQAEALDYSIKDKLFSAAAKAEQDELVGGAVSSFERLTSKYPNSARAQFGLASSLDRQAELKQSNEFLERSIEAYSKLGMSEGDVFTGLRVAALERLSERASFRGFKHKSISAYQKLIEVEPAVAKWRNLLGIHYLINGQNSQAKRVFERVLEKWQDNGRALCHLGFISNSDNNFDLAATQIRKGIELDAGCHEGRFFAKLGDSLLKLDRREEAYKYYQQGADEGLLLSAWQRSLYNAPSLRARPWWKPRDTGHYDYIQKLESSWRVILGEARGILNKEKGAFEPEEEGLTDTGDWKQYTLYQRGRKHGRGCERTPRTCNLLDAMPDATSCSRGQIKFSLMQPGTHVFPHCGPTNCRLRMHLGLIIPDKVRIRVGNHTKKWEEGKVLIFDDSFEHEVWQDSDSLRIILIVDIWHPDLSSHQKRSLSPI